jgi:ribonuclease D
MSFTFDRFRLILSEEGVNPHISILNKIYGKLQKELKGENLDESITECVAAWRETLKKFKCDRPLTPAEFAQIGRMIQTNGRELTLMALVGARHEQASESFNPAQHLSVQRVADSKNFSRFASLGAPKTEAKKTLISSVKNVFKEDMDKTPMTSEARAILENMRKRGLIGE